MVTKNTENNANNALNIIPESASTAVDNDEKYLSFALVLSITIMDNLVKLIGTDGFVLYTYTLQDTATARAVFNELVFGIGRMRYKIGVYLLCRKILDTLINDRKQLRIARRR